MIIMGPCQFDIFYDSIYRFCKIGMGEKKRQEKQSNTGGKILHSTPGHWFKKKKIVSANCFMLTLQKAPKKPTLHLEVFFRKPG